MLLLNKKTGTKKEYKRITYTQAKQLFNNNHNVYIVPSLENINSQNCICINKKQGNFEYIIKEYEYKNKCIVFFYI